MCYLRKERNNIIYEIEKNTVNVPLLNTVTYKATDEYKFYI